jgi:hypothetical protein
MEVLEVVQHLAHVGLGREMGSTGVGLEDVQLQRQNESLQTIKKFKGCKKEHLTGRWTLLPGWLARQFLSPICNDCDSDIKC